MGIARIDYDHKDYPNYDNPDIPRQYISKTSYRLSSLSNKATLPAPETAAWLLRIVRFCRTTQCCWKSWPLGCEKCSLIWLWVSNLFGNPALFVYIMIYHIYIYRGALYLTIVRALHVRWFWGKLSSLLQNLYDLSCVDQNPRKAHPSMSVDGIILLVIQPVDLKMCFFFYQVT